MMTITELIAALEAAEGPSRELDCEFYLAATARPAGYSVANPPHYTSSVDAALTLVPSGNLWEVGNLPGGKGYAWLNGAGEFEIDAFQVNAVTPAIALCIAALKARVEMEQRG